MIYRIIPEKSSTLAASYAKKVTLGIFSCMAFIFFILSMNLNPGKSILPILSKSIPMMCLIFLYIGGMTYYQKKNYNKSLAFHVTNNEVEQILLKDELNIGNKFGIARNQSRFGSTPNQSIPYSEIESININSNRIKIKSVDYNFLNGNGGIEIPKETQQYSDLVDHFTKLKEDLEFERSRH